MEGLVAKDGSSAYVEGRSTKWRKLKVRAEEELVIGGFTVPAGTRAHFGALLLGAYRGADLHYVGSARAGFSERMLASLWQRFQPFLQEQSPFVNPPRACRLPRERR